jgi:hypothetical protein
VIALASPLDLSGPAVQAVALPTAGAPFPAGTGVGLAGFGRSSPTVQTSGPLAWMNATVDPQGECSSSGRGLTANNAIILCASAPASAVCNGDSGSGLVTRPARRPPGVSALASGWTRTTGSFTYTALRDPVRPGKITAEAPRETRRRS